MKSVSFQATEFTSSGTFQTANYEYRPAASGGWTITRNGLLHLELGAGYELIETSSCGVCSTDLARRFLPYPLPQIIGHEVTALKDGRLVVVEINASHLARGVVSTCPFCARGMDTQCPDRITLGIDRLPGGFAPYILAPTHAIIDVPDGIPPRVAALTEPFAAALHALDVTPVWNGAEIAVLGPRRLGSLLIAALDARRRSSGLTFQITALSRHPEHERLLRALGADDVIDVSKTAPPPNSYDVVFDTTGSPQGFESALKVARRYVHLKSTHGQPVLGMRHLTDLVVDEIGLIGSSASAAEFSWISGKQHKSNAVYATSSARECASRLFGPRLIQATMEPKETAQRLLHGDVPQGAEFGRFDIAVVSSIAEADAVVRPLPGEEMSLVRARGAIIVDAAQNAADPISAALVSGKAVHTSRCGDFRKALSLLAGQPEVVQALERLVTHVFPLDKLDQAFQTAASGNSIKVLVDAQRR